MEFKRPTSEQAYWGLRAMKTVALVDGRFDEAERHMLQSIQRVLQTDYDIEALEPIEADLLARSLPDPQIRRQLVNGLIVMSMIDQEATAEETSLIEKYAQALEVPQDNVRNLRQLAEQELFTLRFDLLRRFWVIDKFKEIWHEEGLRGLAKIVGAVAGQYENTALAARYQQLETYPEGSLGREYWKYCRKNGFPLPGEKGSAPETIIYHDCSHILSGYDTDPAGEVQVACFSAGYRRKDPFTFVFFVLLQFHLGIRMTPITQAKTGFFDPETALIALQRGAAMSIDLTEGWDYWSAMRESVDSLRHQYTIPPLPERKASR